MLYTSGCCTSDFWSILSEPCICSTFVDLQPISNVGPTSSRLGPFPAGVPWFVIPCSGFTQSFPSCPPQHQPSYQIKNVEGNLFYKKKRCTEGFFPILWMPDVDNNFYGSVTGCVALRRQTTFLFQWSEFHTFTIKVPSQVVIIGVVTIFVCITRMGSMDILILLYIDAQLLKYFTQSMCSPPRPFLPPFGGWGGGCLNVFFPFKNGWFSLGGILKKVIALKAPKFTWR